MSLIGLVASAQSLDDMYEHGIAVHIIQSAPGYTSLGFQFAHAKTGAKKFAFEYGNLLVPDGIIATVNTLSEKHPDKSYFTNIWGSFGFGVNAISKDKFTLAAGLSITDYWKMGSDGGGWYTGGTFVRADYLVAPKLMLRLRNYTSKSFYSASSIFGAGDNAEGMPLFMRTGLEVQYTPRFVLGVEAINLISGPEFNKTRMNFTLGYRISKWPF